MSLPFISLAPYMPRVVDIHYEATVYPCVDCTDCSDATDVTDVTDDDVI